MREAFEVFFIHIFDLPFAMQILCATVSTVLLLGVRKQTKIRRIVIDIVWLYAVFFALHTFFNVVGWFLPRRLAFTSDLVYFLGIILYTVTASRHKWISRLAMASVVFSLNTLMASLGTVFGNAIEMHFDGFDISITKIIAYLIVVACSVVFFKYPLFKFETNLFDCILNVVCNVLSALLFVIYEYVRRSSHEWMTIGFQISGFMTVVIIFLFAINIVTYFMTYKLCGQRERALDLSLQAQKEQGLKELLKLNESKLAELREVRHDVKNQYAYMQMLLENDKFDELKAYFDEVLGTLAKPLFKSVDSGNALIDSVLNLGLTKASEAGVALDLRVSVPPVLPFSKSTLLSLFANVIDNAVEAVVRDGMENATVEVTLGMQGDYMLFCVSNPTRLEDSESIDDLVTSKSDKTVHGLGSKIIKKTVKKCNGYCRRFVKDGKFVSECLLDTLYKEKSGGGGGAYLKKKRLNIAVCDDELKTLDIIIATVEKCFSSHDIETDIDGFRTPDELWQTLGKQSYNLVFLDINMPDTDGVALGKKISELTNRPDIIFVSSNTDRVFDTFVVNPFGFVRKSEFLKDVASVIDRYVAKRSDEPRTLLRFDMKDRGGLVALDVSQLKYVECLRNEQMFYMDGLEDRTVRSRMEELEKTLAPYDFVRIHKGYLVNYAYIRRFDNNDVTLVSGEVLPVGRSKRADAMEKYLEYVHKHGTSIIG